ncbi:hypothetical protein X975_24969, partial [Stegodyphus mimosarum]
MKLRIKRYEKDWPCSVEFSGEHNHSLTSAAALTYRPISPDVLETIKELFRRGHTPSTAYITYCTTMMEKMGNEYYDVC